MANIAIYNPSSVVANQVIQYVTSVNTPDYDYESNKLVNPDLSSVVDQPMKWWKVSGGSVVLMSSGEQATVDAALLPGMKTAKKTSLQSSADNLITSRGYNTGVKSNILSMYSDGIRIKPKRAKHIQPWVNWLSSVDVEVKNKSAVVDAATTIAEVDAVVLDTATLIAADPQVTLSGALGVVDSEDLTFFVDGNTEVTDPPTSKKGPLYLMQEFVMRRDLYGDSENPLYYSGQNQAILGATGILTDHADRILNLETIHSKYGWHEIQVIQATYKRPLDLLIYYGYPNSFNSDTNAWYNERVAQDMAKYSLIVLGDTVENPAHPDYANTQIIIPRIKALNPSALIFGYVACAQSLANFQDRVDQWDTLQVHGIFADEAGYDYGKTRAEFNTMVDYIHGKTYAKICFANAWNTDNILGTVDDASFPNATYNPTVAASKIAQDDWILLESLAVNTTAYSGSNGYESKSDWYVRCQKIINLRATYGVNFAASCVINNDNVNGQNLFNFAFISSMLYNIEAYGSSDISYASGSAAVAWWTRPDISNMGKVWYLYPSVQNDVGDADIYHRYVEFAKMSLDFSSGAQLSSITKR